MDFSFVRGGRPLEAWLPELVSEDRGQRIAAAAMLIGTLSVCWERSGRKRTAMSRPTRSARRIIR
jgi:hypothetical protein